MKGTKKVRTIALTVGTLCSGYDSQCMALDRIKNSLKWSFPNFEYDLLFWAEIDRYAIKAHNAVYHQYKERNIGDITQVDWHKVPKVEMLFYTTPCTDISNAGMRKGMAKDSNTRSSLIWEVERAAEILRPKIMVMENVKDITNKRNIEHFNRFKQILSGLGYTNHVVLMNAKDYMVPQNRERVFMVSIHQSVNIDFQPPKPYYYHRLLFDVLENNVDKKYLLTQKQQKRLEKIVDSIRLDFSLQNKVKQIANIVNTGNFSNPQRGRIYDSWGIAPTLNTLSGGGLAVKIYHSGKYDGTKISVKNFRTLTPREYFRLMDVPEEYIDKIQAAGISDTQQYKMAGNSIVVACLYHLLQSIFNPII